MQVFSIQLNGPGEKKEENNIREGVCVIRRLDVNRDYLDQNNLLINPGKLLPSVRLF